MKFLKSWAVRKRWRGRLFFVMHTLLLKKILLLPPIIHSHETLILHRVAHLGNAQHCRAGFSAAVAGAVAAFAHVVETEITFSSSTGNMRIATVRSAPRWKRWFRQQGILYRLYLQPLTCRCFAVRAEKRSDWLWLRWLAAVTVCAAAILRLWLPCRFCYRFRMIKCRIWGQWVKLASE